MSGWKGYLHPLKRRKKKKKREAIRASFNEAMSAQVGVSEPLDERYLASRASNLPLNQLRNEGYKRTRQMANLRCFVRAVCYLSPTGHSESGARWYDLGVKATPFSSKMNSRWGITLFPWMFSSVETEILVYIHLSLLIHFSVYFWFFHV